MRRFHHRGPGLRSDRRRSALRVSAEQHLAGTYPDEVVESLAAEDGQAQLLTQTWGPSNRDPRVVLALNEGAKVSASLVSYELHAQLPLIEEELEKLAARAPGAEAAALSAIDDAGAADKERANLRRACQDEQLPQPEHHWRRTGAEIVGLAALGFGDLFFTSTTFEVFGLSDRNVGVLPFNELQLVASSTVIAMLLLTRLAGHNLRLAVHHLERTRSDRSATQADAQRHGRTVVRAWFYSTSALMAVVGAGVILVGLSEVRASYLAQSGIDAHAGQFLAIQAGIAAAGLALSVWLAHPYQRDWRSAVAHQRDADRVMTGAVEAFADVVGRFNTLLRVRAALFAQHRDWSIATGADAERKGHLYARRVQLAQPEPTKEELFPAGLPAPEDPALLGEVNEFLGGRPSVFKAYEPLSMVRVEGRLGELDDHRRGHDGAEATADTGNGNATAKPGARVPAASNGKPK